MHTGILRLCAFGGVRAIGVLTLGAMGGMAAEQTAQHIVALIAAALITFVLTVAETVITVVSGGQDRSGYVNNHKNTSNISK